MQHFEKEIKCDLLSHDPAILCLQILFVLQGVKIFDIIILQYFIIIIFCSLLQLATHWQSPVQGRIGQTWCNSDGSEHFPAKTGAINFIREK